MKTGIANSSGLAVVLALVLTTPGYGQTKPATPDAKSEQAGKPAGKQAGKGADSAFMTQAASSGMAEVELGRLAAERASSADVKAFAQKMVDDHTKANGELKALAATKGVTLPAAPDPKHRGMHEKLAAQKGPAFDKEYMAGQVKAHQEAVTLFEREAASGMDPETKAWAAKTLPQLREHLKMAQKTAGAAGK
jgi:putative membrane protein